jgi:hypothetical protein
VTLSRRQLEPHFGVNQARKRKHTCGGRHLSRGAIEMSLAGAEFDAAAFEFCKQIRVFMDEHIASREAEWRTQARTGAYPLHLLIVLERPAREQGLLTAGAPRQPRVPLAEARAGSLAGRSIQLQFA